jgi:hypothetical protein
VLSDDQIDPKSGFTPGPTEKTSALLIRVLALLPEPEVRIGDVVRNLSRRSFGGLLVILAALAVLPGVSFFAGLAMVLPGIQMALGLNVPILPKFIRARKINTADIRSHGERAVRRIQWIEYFVKPRFVLLSSKPMLMLIGVLVVALALVVMLPLPFSNLPPAVALLCLALGIMERDGLLILTGFFIGVLAIVVGSFVGSFAIAAVLKLA